MHRLSILITLAAASVLAIAPAAHASVTSNAQELESIVSGGTSAGAVMPAGGSVSIQAPLPGNGASHLGENNQGTTPGSRQGARKSLSRKAPKPRIRCLVNGSSGPMTCTYYRSGKAYKRCRFPTHRLKHGTCHRIAHRSATAGAVGTASAASQGPIATAASIKWQGFPSSPLSQVGKIFQIQNGRFVEQCSGTLITATLVLTAGHCVYDIDTHRYFDALYFVPGGSYNASAGAVKMNEPYGVWKGYAWWTTGRYQSSGDSGLDWGLIELQPEDGVFPGRQLGSFQAYYGLSWPLGTRVYEVGYPASGTWRGASFFEGRSQYACDTTYDSYQAEPSGYGLVSLCSMNGGASGGPWFRNINGTWVVAGINDLCTPKTDEVEGCAPYSTQLISNYFDNRFGTFFNSIVPGQLHF